MIEDEAMFEFNDGDMIEGKSIEDLSISNMDTETPPALTKNEENNEEISEICNDIADQTGETSFESTILKIPLYNKLLPMVEKTPYVRSARLQIPSRYLEIVGKKLVKSLPGNEMGCADIKRLFWDNNNKLAFELVFENNRIEISSAEAVRKLVKLSIEEDRFSRYEKRYGKNPNEQPPSIFTTTSDEAANYVTNPDIATNSSSSTEHSFKCESTHLSPLSECDTPPSLPLPSTTTSIPAVIPVRIPVTYGEGFRVGNGYILFDDRTILKKCTTCSKRHSGLRVCRWEKKHTAPNWDEPNGSKVILPMRILTQIWGSEYQQQKLVETSLSEEVHSIDSNDTKGSNDNSNSNDDDIDGGGDDDNDNNQENEVEELLVEEKEEDNNDGDDESIIKDENVSNNDNDINNDDDIVVPLPVAYSTRSHAQKEKDKEKEMEGLDSDPSPDPNDLTMTDDLPDKDYHDKTDGLGILKLTFTSKQLQATSASSSDSIPRNTLTTFTTTTCNSITSATTTTTISATATNRKEEGLSEAMQEAVLSYPELEDDSDDDDDVLPAREQEKKVKQWLHEFQHTRSTTLSDDMILTGIDNSSISNHSANQSQQGGNPGQEEENHQTKEKLLQDRKAELINLMANKIHQKGSSQLQIHDIEFLRARRLPRATAALKGDQGRFLDVLPVNGNHRASSNTTIYSSSTIDSSHLTSSTVSNNITVKNKKNIVAATQIAKQLLSVERPLSGSSSSSNSSNGSATGDSKDDPNEKDNLVTSKAIIQEHSESVANTNSSSTSSIDPINLPLISNDALPFVEHLVSLVDDKLQAKTHISQALHQAKSRSNKEFKRRKMYCQAISTLSQRLTATQKSFEKAEEDRRAQEMAAYSELKSLEDEEKELLVRLKKVQERIVKRKQTSEIQKEANKRMRISEKGRLHYAVKDVNNCKEILSKVETNISSVATFENYVIDTLDNINNSSRMTILNKTQDSSDGEIDTNMLCKEITATSSAMGTRVQSKNKAQEIEDIFYEAISLKDMNMRRNLRSSSTNGDSHTHHEFSQPSSISSIDDMLPHHRLLFEKSRLISSLVQRYHTDPTPITTPTTNLPSDYNTRILSKLYSQVTDIESIIYPPSNSSSNKNITPFLQPVPNIDTKQSRTTLVLYSPELLKHQVPIRMVERSMRIIKIMSTLKELEKRTTKIVDVPTSSTVSTTGISDHQSSSSTLQDPIIVGKHNDTNKIPYAYSPIMCLEISEKYPSPLLFHECLSLVHADSYLTYLQQRIKLTSDKKTPFIRLKDRAVYVDSDDDLAFPPDVATTELSDRSGTMTVTPHGRSNISLSMGISLDGNSKVDESTHFDSSSNSNIVMNSTSNNTSKLLPVHITATPSNNTNPNMKNNLTAFPYKPLRITRDVYDSIIKVKMEPPEPGYTPNSYNRLWLWDTVRKRRVGGSAAPYLKGLQASLDRNRGFVIYHGQDGKPYVPPDHVECLRWLQHHVLKPEMTSISQAGGKVTKNALPPLLSAADTTGIGNSSISASASGTLTSHPPLSESISISDKSLNAMTFPVDRIQCKIDSNSDTNKSCLDNATVMSSQDIVSEDDCWYMLSLPLPPHPVDYQLTSDFIDSYEYSESCSDNDDIDDNNNNMNNNINNIIINNSNNNISNSSDDGIAFHSLTCVTTEDNNNVENVQTTWDTNTLQSMGQFNTINSNKRKLENPFEVYELYNSNSTVEDNTSMSKSKSSSRHSHSQQPLVTRASSLRTVDNILQDGVRQSNHHDLYGNSDDFTETGPSHDMTPITNMSDNGSYTIARRSIQSFSATVIQSIFTAKIPDNMTPGYIPYLTQRVWLWDPLIGRRYCGNKSPFFKNFHNCIAKNPNLIMYYNQDKKNDMPQEQIDLILWFKQKLLRNELIDFNSDSYTYFKHVPEENAIPPSMEAFRTDQAELCQIGDASDITKIAIPTGSQNDEVHTIPTAMEDGATTIAEVVAVAANTDVPRQEVTLAEEARMEEAEAVVVEETVSQLMAGGVVGETEPTIEEVTDVAVAVTGSDKRFLEVENNPKTKKIKVSDDLKSTIRAVDEMCNNDGSTSTTTTTINITSQPMDVSPGLHETYTNVKDTTIFDNTESVLKESPSVDLVDHVNNNSNIHIDKDKTFLDTNVTVYETNEVADVDENNKDAGEIVAQTKIADLEQPQDTFLSITSMTREASSMEVEDINPEKDTVVQTFQVENDDAPMACEETVIDSCNDRNRPQDSEDEESDIVLADEIEEAAREGFVQPLENKATLATIKSTLSDISGKGNIPFTEQSNNGSFVTAHFDDWAVPGQGWWEELECGTSDTFLSSGSMDAAFTAAAIVCHAIDAVVAFSNSIHSEASEKFDNKTTIIENAFCCIRPPGHHAGRYGNTKGCAQNGFCLLNNIVIGGMYARVKYGLRRFAIIDFDAHFGNGTAEILENDSNAFFASIHLQYENNKYFFPSSECCSLGADRIDKNHVFVNIYPNLTRYQQPPGKPVRRGRVGFRDALTNIVLPALRIFKPEIILISAGFDGASSDPIGGQLGLREVDFHWMGRMIRDAARELCGGRLVSVLEGGYDINDSSNGLAKCVESHVSGLAGLSYNS